MAITDTTLGLNFLTGTLDSRVTFTRASTGTYVNASGTLQTASSNVARFDYDPITLLPLGILIEEARTNLLLNSATLSDLGLTNTTRTGASGTAPDGGNNAVSCAETAATGSHSLWAAQTVTASSTYTFSCYAKQSAGRYLQLSYDDGGSNYAYATFDLLTGCVSQAIATAGTATAVSAAISFAAQGFYRCSITAAITGTTARTGLVMAASGTPGAPYPSYLGTAGKNVLVWGTQLELGAWPTSYIPTSGATATRALDVATVATGAWFSSSTGTLEVEWDTVRTTSPVPVGLAKTGDFNNSTYLSGNSALALIAGVSASAAGSTVSLPGRFDQAFSYQSGKLSVCNGGGTVATAVIGSGPFPWVNVLSIGDTPWGASVTICGHVRTVSYWNRALSNDELQAVTATVTDTSLDLNLLSGTLDGRVTFTRSTTASYYDSTGIVRSAAINVPRFDYDPVTLLPRGLFLEEARTNSCVNSTTFSLAWGSGLTVTPAAAVAPDGTTTASQVTNTGSAGVVSSYNAAPAAGTYTLSLWARANVAGSRTCFTTYINGSQVATQTNFTLTTAWQRLVFPAVVVPASSTNLGIQINLSGADTIFLWGTQVELGTFPTSYIPTTGTAVTRAADVNLMPAPATFSPSAGTVLIDFYYAYPPAVAANFLLAELSNNGDSNNDLRFYVTAGGANLTASMSTAGALANIVNGSGNTANAAHAAAVTWNATALSDVTDGGTVTTSTTFTASLPTLNRIMMGCWSAGNFTLCGYVRRFRYWNRSLSNAELQLATAPIYYPDRVRTSTATTGTGTITLGAAITGYRSFAAAVSAGALVSGSVCYAIEDTNNAWEVGSGIYTAGAETLTRTVTASSLGGTTALTLSGSAQVYPTLTAAPLNTLLGNQVAALQNAGSITIGNSTATQAVLSLSAISGSVRGIYWNSIGGHRWAAYADSVSEAGSNAGCNFNIACYSDTGIVLFTPLQITRSTGMVLINNGIDISGTATAPTASLNTNTTQIATTAYVIGQASTTTPLMASSASIGSATTFARADHRHPADTSRQAALGFSAVQQGGGTGQTTSDVMYLGWTTGATGAKLTRNAVDLGFIATTVYPQTFAQTGTAVAFSSAIVSSSSVGQIALTVGDGTHSGRIDFRNATGTVLGYLGYGTSGGPLQLYAQGTTTGWATNLGFSVGTAMTVGTSITTTGSMLVDNVTYIRNVSDNFYLHFTGTGWQTNYWNNGSGNFCHLLQSDNNMVYYNPTTYLYYCLPDGNFHTLRHWYPSYTSDIRTKQNVQPYTRVLADLVQLRPVSYQYNGLGGTTDNGETKYGLTAQQAQPFVPECVSVIRDPEDAPEGRTFVSERLPEQLKLDDEPLIFAYLNAFREIDARLQEIENQLGLPAWVSED